MTNKRNSGRGPHKIEMTDEGTDGDTMETSLNWLISGADHLGQEIIDTMKADGWPDHNSSHSGKGYDDASQAFQMVHCMIHQSCNVRSADPLRATDSELANGVRTTAAESSQTAIAAMAVCKILTDDRLTMDQRWAAASRLCAVLCHMAVGGLATVQRTDSEICTAIALKMAEGADQEDKILQQVVDLARRADCDLPENPTISDLHEALDRIVKRNKEGGQ